MTRFHLPFHVHLSRRARLAVRYGGFALLAWVIFVFALQLSFPYERLRDRAIDALAANYELQIGDVERGLLPGRVYFHDVTLRGRATKPDEVVTPLFIRRLKVDASLLALLRRSVAIDFDASIGDAKNGVGHIAGNITLPKFGKAGIAVDVEGRELPGASLPLRSVVGLPILGKLDFAFKLDLPITANKAKSGFDWRKAGGVVELSCPARCTIGDGHTRLKPLVQDRTKQAMVADGIDFGKLDVDSLSARAIFTPEVGNPDARSSSYKPGKFELQKFELKSPDGELHVDYAMTMAQEFGDSMVAGCLRYKASERLLQKDETKRTYAAISTIGAELRSDGLFHIRLTDRFKEMRRLNQECGPTLKAAGGGGDDVRARSPGDPRPGIAVDDAAQRAAPRPGVSPTPTPEPVPTGAPAPSAAGPAATPGYGTPPGGDAGMPGAPAMPSAPGSPSGPGASGAPGMPPAPGTPGPAAMPVPPGAPGAPGASPAPTTPGAAPAPGAAATPAAPGTPGAPGMPAPGQSGTPGSADSTPGSPPHDYPNR